MEMLDQRVLVGHHKHGGTPAVDLTEKVYDFKGEGRVDVAGGLVRHNHRGVIHQRARQPQALAFAARKLCGVMLRLVLQADQAEDIGHPLADGLGRSPHHTHGKRHIVVDRHVVYQAEILENNSHLPADVGNLPLADAGHIHAVHDDLAGVGPLFAHDKL